MNSGLNYDFILGIVEIMIGSFMALLCILVYSKTKRLEYYFFILTGFFLYVLTIFRVLESVNIFSLSDYRIFNFPVFKFLISNAPSFLIIAGFIMILRNKR